MSYKLKPFDMVVEEFKFKRIGGMYQSTISHPSINKDMIPFFGKEIEIVESESTSKAVKCVRNVGTYRGTFWTFSRDWLDKDPFKVSEINDMFGDIMEGIDVS